MILTQGKIAQNHDNFFTNHLCESVMSTCLPNLKFCFDFWSLRMARCKVANPRGPLLDIERLVVALLSGQLAEDQRIELCEELRGQPAWLAWLAEQIKKRRKPPRLNLCGASSFSLCCHSAQ